MKYFLHDSNAFNDEKITQLFMQFGYEGLGLFYTTLEKLASQEKPMKTEVLKAQLKVGKKLNKCWNFMESLGILSSNNGETFNKQLLNFSEKYRIKKEKNNERIKQWREKQEDTENVTHFESVRNAPKDNISKVKLSKVNSIDDRKAEFSASLQPFLEKYGKDTLNDFFRHWTEKNQSQTKMKFEVQKFFEISKRLITWKNNEEKFKQNGSTQKNNHRGLETSTGHNKPFGKL